MNNVFLQIANISITAGWIVIAVILLRLLFKKAPKWVNCLLWGIVGLRLVFPLSIESALSLIPSVNTISAPTSYNPSSASIETGFSTVDTTMNGYIGDHFIEGITVSANAFSNITTVLSYIWIAGVIIMLIYAGISYIRLKNKMRTSTPLRDNIRQSENVASPFILGIIKPKIYLPYSIDNDEAECIIAHEKTHLKRFDHIIKPLAFIILSVYWFNPLMWVAYILLCRDIELACDEKVINSMAAEERQSYSLALLQNSVNRRSVSACPLAFGEVGVKQRIKSVMSYKKPTLWIIIIAVILCVIASVCFLTDPKTDVIKFPNISVNYATVKNSYISDYLESYYQPYELSEHEKADLSKYLRKIKAKKKEKDNITTTPTFILSVKAEGYEPIEIHYYFNENYALLYYEKECYTVKNESFMSYIYNLYTLGNSETTSKNIDAIIEKAVMNHYADDNIPTGIINVESHIKLSEGRMIDTDKNSEDTFYLLVLYNSYSFDGELNKVSSEYIPTAITFAINKSGDYELKEYWTPRDGSFYAKDIKEKFPKESADELENEEYRNRLESECYKKAKAYITGLNSPETRINELLNVICSSPAQSSNPGDYINEHKYEYNEIIKYGDDALRYIYSEFLKGNQTDLRGHVMALIMRDLLENEEINTNADFGQEYFDKFLNNAKDTRVRRGDEYMEKYTPRAYMLLEMAGE